MLGAPSFEAQQEGAMPRSLIGILIAIILIIIVLRLLGLI
jgi:hypothetical protein